MKKNQLYITNRDEWREWLRKNHKSKSEIWLIYYKKHTGKPRIPYDDAVEEALCYGWIDTTVKRIDEEIYMQKFTPRNKKSMWSKLNKQRVGKMIKAGKMRKPGMDKVNEAKRNGEWDAASSVKDEIPMPTELVQALAKNKKAEENFYNFAPSYRRNYIGWVAAAKRSETRDKRIKEVVKRAEENIKPGML
jgi:uncharacterized protein YdeI (YjbR/CyaY-like superfamily)